MTKTTTRKQSTARAQGALEHRLAERNRLLGVRTFTPPNIALSDFMQLTKVPIIVYHGDNIPEQPTTNPGQDQWRVFRAVARQWRDAVNRHGGDDTLVELPAIGIRGNTHFPMSDLNKIEIANHLSVFLRSKHLD